MDKLRKIVFRGYNKKRGEWLYGSYIQNRGAHFIAPDEFADGKTWEDYEVEEESIGQFTGLTDKNGREIYEGDVIMSGSGFYGVIKWSKYGYFYIRSDGDKEDPLDYATLGYMLRQCDFKLIGNEFENKELLEKGGQDA